MSTSSYHFVFTATLLCHTTTELGAEEEMWEEDVSSECPDSDDDPEFLPPSDCSGSASDLDLDDDYVPPSVASEPSDPYPVLSALMEGTRCGGVWVG